jgi:hypothetical protein
VVSMPSPPATPEGAPVWPSTWEATSRAGMSDQVQEPVPPPPAAPLRGKFVVQATHASLPFPPGRSEIIIGREDPVNGIFPEIDLTDHGGDEGGVSRRHARVTLQGGRFAIEDLNSTNHTFVNRVQLGFGERRILEEGDEVTFGRVSMTFQIL